LEKVKTTSPDGKPQVFYWMGARAEIDITKKKILHHVAEVYGDKEIDPILEKEVEDEMNADKDRTEVGGGDVDGQSQRTQEEGLGGRGRGRVAGRGGGKKK